MKQVFLILFGLMFISTAVINPIIAQPNHTFEWGIEIGETFTYVVQRKIINADPQSVYGWLPFAEDIDEGQMVIVNITGHESIQDEIVDTTDLPATYCAIIRANDSQVIAEDVASLFLPIGDWDLMTEITDAGSTIEYQFIDTEGDWGVRYGYEINSIQYQIEQTYEKTNGTLRSYRVSIASSSQTFADIIFAHWYEGMPTVLPLDNPLETILLVGIGGAIVLVVALVTYIAIKGRKSLAQRLGE